MSSTQRYCLPTLATWASAGHFVCGSICGRPRNQPNTCFTTGAQERKARNLEHNPRCVLTNGTNTLTGVDVVIEGVASVVGERSERVQAVADFERKYGAHLTSPEGAWNGLGEAVIAGGTRLYRAAPTVGFAFGKLPTSSQTRYTWPRR
jgi:hypothetical protein